MKEKIAILCVDDELNILKTLERFCRNEGFHPYLASTIGEGLDIMESTSPIHIVISDYRMPEMNGVELLRRIHLQWPQTVNILLSGYADIPVVSQAINDGYIHSFLTKPWKRDELKSTIRSALDLLQPDKETTRARSCSDA